MRGFTRRTLGLICLLSAAGLALAGCSRGENGMIVDFGANKFLELRSFSSCAELESEVRALLLGQVHQEAQGMLASCRWEGDSPVMAPADGSGREVQASQEGVGVTATNVQEEGVDEADLVKSDGAITAAILKGKVVIARSWPLQQFGELARITPSADPVGLYLVGARLIVLSQRGDPFRGGGVIPLVAEVGGDDSPAGGNDEEPEVVEEVYDLADPTNPRLARQESYSGLLLSSRRIGATLFIVLSDEGVVMPQFDHDLGIEYEDLPACPEGGVSEPNDALREAVAAFEERGRAAIESVALAELMPHVGTSGSVACTEIARSNEAAGTQLMAIATDRYEDAGALPAMTGLLGSGGTVYVSTGSIYVASENMPWSWWAVPETDWTETSVLHRFAIEGGSVAYAGSAVIDGRVLDNRFAGSRYSQRFSMASFAMSEYQGHLRVATTAESSVNGEWRVDSRVQLFAVAGGAPAKVGEVSGIGAGEQLRAVRFLGDRGYVVTFQKTDPLFVVDLSSPAAPAISGELQVPGFSTYLHPLGEGELIGLGFDAEDEGGFAWTQGLKLALFDVSDPAAPAEVGHRELGGRGSYSPAVEEHHAFTLDRGRGLIALPVDLYQGGGGGEYGTHAFSGVLLLRTDDGGAFATAGQIEIEPSSGELDPWAYPSAGVLRTAIIGDDAEAAVITLGDERLQVNRIDAQMSEVGTIL